MWKCKAAIEMNDWKVCKYSVAQFECWSRFISVLSPGYFLQVLDVERMVAKNTMPQTQDQGAGTNLENHPVIRTLYDHMDVRH